nr:hypothetical protein [Tanacetum cinerariifolium]
CKTNVLVEAYQRAKAAAATGGTNTLGDLPTRRKYVQGAWWKVLSVTVIVGVNVVRRTYWELKIQG